MGWLITFGILALIAILPIGLRLIYDSGGFRVSFLCGMLSFRLHWPEKNNKKESKQNHTKANAKNSPKTNNTDQKGGKWTDFLPLVKIFLSFLGSLRRKIRIKKLYLNVIMASDDPCDLGIHYAKAWTAVGSLLPLLEQVFTIKSKDVEIQCDFTAESTLVRFRADVMISFGRLVCLVVKYGVKALLEYNKIINLRKGGADS